MTPTPADAAPDATASLIDRLRDEAEFHCVGEHQGFSATDVQEERELMALLTEAATEISRAKAELAAMKAERDGAFERVEKLSAGFMSESNHELFCAAINALSGQREGEGGGR